MVNKTPNFGIPLPLFNKITYHDDYYAFARIVDTVLNRYITINNLQGIWENSTLYSIGESVVTFDNSSIYTCLVEHTSSALPTTFSDELVLHPSYWEEDSGRISKVEELTAGATLVAGNVCYLSAIDGKMEIGDASSSSSSVGLLGICRQSSINEDDEGTFLISGVYTTSGLTTGATYYLSKTPGGFTSVAPSVAGDIVRIIGYALSSTELLFTPDNSYIELS
jgi:hypothetical protein